MVGKEYNVAYIAMIILILANIFYSLSHIYSNLLQMLKKTKTIFVIFLISIVINIVLNIILIPPYGIIGAAIAAAVYLLSLYLLMSLATYKFKKIQILRFIYLKSIIAILITTIIIIQIAKWLKPESIINLILLSLILFVIYIVLVIIFKGLEKEDITIIKDLKGKLLTKHKKTL
mgnify:FL=1